MTEIAVSNPTLRRIVTEAYERAAAAHHKTPKCYLAAVRALQGHLPHFDRERVAQMAVSIVLEERLAKHFLSEGQLPAGDV